MPDCVVFDIDGTLADAGDYLWHLQNKDGSPKLSSEKDWTAYFAGIPHFTLIEPVATICRALSGRVLILYATGRSEEHIEDTHTWIQKHSLPMSTIYHRAKGDFRNDNIVKLELLEEIRADGFNIIMIFDDRARVVSAMRKAGYPVAQVAEGDY